MARARPLRLLGGRLMALNGVNSRRGERAGPPGVVQPRPRLLELAASELAASRGRGQAQGQGQ
eukprot:scaffold125658_cov18-Phaeocystis_antarctica.AAC.1